MKPEFSIDWINHQFQLRGLYTGRMISATKQKPPGEICVWNANVVSRSMGKVWYGDLNITREGSILKAIAAEIGEPLYVLREFSCRFETERDPVDVLISRSVWDTTHETSKTTL